MYIRIDIQSQILTSKAYFTHFCCTAPVIVTYNNCNILLMFQIECEAIHETELIAMSF